MNIKFINSYDFIDLAAPCSAGSYMTETGCQQCGVNTFSGPGASTCTSCPDEKIAPAGSTSEDDCHYGKNVYLSHDKGICKGSMTYHIRDGNDV